jgi:MoxR-like ATPase
VFHAPKLRLAVNVALVTGRPLFVRGVSGSGKSSLARSVARLMKRRYYENVISSRTQVRDLLWSVDELQRLRDARADQSLEIARYIEPGTLWWAFDPVGASRMGRAVDPVIIDWTKEKPTPEAQAEIPAVVLLDEIDKADPDLPNDLLVPLGSLRFDVPDIDPPHVVAPETDDPRKRLLIVITTNEEREMPPAFLRRCVVVTLPAPDETTLVRIATAHFGDAEKGRFEKIARSVVAASARKPSAAEYLDTILASRDLGIAVDGPEWPMLAELTLWKGSES